MSSTKTEETFNHPGSFVVRGEMTTGLLLGLAMASVSTSGRSRPLRLRHGVYEGYGTPSRLGDRLSEPSSCL